MSGSKPTKTLTELAMDTSKYPVEAFEFVREGLQFTVERIHGECQAEPTHITGRDLCWGLRDFATQRWGLMAIAVLRNWNIRRTRDFGAVVFAMVEAGWMAKNDNDSIDDFANVFGFGSAFNSQFSIDVAGELG